MNLEKGIAHTKISVIANAVQYLQPILNKTCDEILRDFIASDIYDMVQETETRMWAESGQYVGEWYIEFLRRKNSATTESTDADETAYFKEI